MSREYYLYRHIRLDTNEPFYIGYSTKTLNYNSLATEYTRAFVKSKRTKFWKNIINKTKYEVEIIFETNSLDLIKLKEIEFISLYGRKDLETGTLVNLTDGGEGACNMSEESKLKLVATRKRNGLNFVSEESRRKIYETKKERNQFGLTIGNKNGMFGKTPWNKGKNWSIEVREKITKNNKCQIAVIKLSLDGIILGEYKSITQAAKDNNMKISSISMCLNKKSRHSGGFIWKYKYERT